jgi:hypothetical protein
MPSRRNRSLSGAVPLGFRSGMAQAFGLDTAELERWSQGLAGLSGCGTAFGATAGIHERRSGARKCLNLLENASDGRWRAGHESSKRVHDGEPNYFCPNPFPPVVDASALRASFPSSRNIPNNAKHFRAVPFSAPSRGEWSASPRRVRFLLFPPALSPTPENARGWLTQPSSRFTFFEFPAYVYSSVPLARSTRQRNDRKADFRCGANPQRGEPS